MKHLLLAIFALINIDTFGQANDLKGKWKDDQGIGYEMEFFGDGKGKIGGGGELLIMEYSVDFTKEPAWIDITVMPLDEPARKAFGLIMFIHKDNFIAEINAEARPAKINPLSLDYVSMVRLK